MYGAQPLLLREPKRFAHDRGDGRRADDLPRHLGQRRHGRDDVNDLEQRLLVAQEPVLKHDLAPEVPDVELHQPIERASSGMPRARYCALLRKGGHRDIV
jgi:hypothetical protein